MELFADIFKIIMIAAIAVAAVIWIVFESIALRDQNEKKDGDTE